MLKSNRFIIRRTLSQERFEVLWGKVKKGQANLRDLAEIDEIVNRDEGVRLFVLEEMRNHDNPQDMDDFQNTFKQPVKPASGFLNKIKAFFNKLLNINTVGLKWASVN